MKRMLLTALALGLSACGGMKEQGSQTAKDEVYYKICDPLKNYCLGKDGEKWIYNITGNAEFIAQYRAGMGGSFVSVAESTQSLLNLGVQMITKTPPLRSITAAYTTETQKTCIAPRQWVSNKAKWNDVLTMRAASGICQDVRFFVLTEYVGD